MDSWEFGPTVRHWRDRVAPASVGVAQGRRRRATGLRREELAELAGISVDYLTRLEQGRGTPPPELAAISCVSLPRLERGRAPPPAAQVGGPRARALRRGRGRPSLFEPGQ